MNESGMYKRIRDKTFTELTVNDVFKVMVAYGVLKLVNDVGSSMATLYIKKANKKLDMMSTGFKNRSGYIDTKEA
jgi:hypothetical protein